MKKLILLLCVLNLSVMLICERMEQEGELLARLGNLPHRSLGVLWWAMTLQPHRSDYVKAYLIQYMIATDGELIQEGMNRPVISMFAVCMARTFPKNKDLQDLATIVMHNHFEKLRIEAANTSKDKSLK